MTNGLKIVVADNEFQEIDFIKLIWKIIYLYI